MSDIAIITGSTSNFLPAEISSVEISKLCQKVNIPFFNYNFDEFSDLKIKPSWHKLYAVIDTFTKFQNVFWIDADIVPVSTFLNNDIELEEFKDDLKLFINSNYYQALVCYTLKSNLAPNMGLFFAKRIMIKYYMRYLYGLAIDGTRRSDASGWFEQTYAAKYMGFKNFSIPLGRSRGRAARNVKLHNINSNNNNKQFNGWRVENATELFNNTMWLGQHYNCFDFERVMSNDITYDDLTEDEKRMFKEKRIPKNGGSISGEKEWFYHSFSPLKDQRLSRLKSKI